MWIIGETGLGKTRLKEQLMDRLRVYEMPYDGGWFDEYEDGKYDLIVFDEFKGGYTPQVMNRICGSEFTSLPRRGRAPVGKRDRLPVIVLSNYGVNDCFNKLDRGNAGLVALRRRVIQVTLREKIDMWWPDDETIEDSCPTTVEEEYSEPLDDDKPTWQRIIKLQNGDNSFKRTKLV